MVLLLFSNRLTNDYEKNHQALKFLFRYTGRKPCAGLFRTSEFSELWYSRPKVKVIVEVHVTHSISQTRTIGKPYRSGIRYQTLSSRIFMRNKIKRAIYPHIQH